MPIDSPVATASRANRSHRRLIAGAIMVFVVAALMSTADPASADEFTVGIIVQDPASESSSASFMQGFQLAVDQSPDVSHPPNVEGGDHLGSMDVVMVVVDGPFEPGGVIPVAVELVTDNRLPILVVDLQPDVLNALIGPVTETGTVVIAMSDVSVVELPPTQLLFLASEQGTGALLTDRTPRFEDAFIAENDTAPSPSAARGYVAGRLVDLSVEATDRDPFDSETLLMALQQAAVVPATTADVVDDEASQGVLPDSLPGTGSGFFAAVAVIGLVLAGGVHVYWAAGGTWPGSDRADLARKVVGSTDEFPSTAMTLGVAVLLMMGAAVVGGATGQWVLPASDSLITAAARAVAGVLILRAVVGFVLSGRRQASGRGTPFSIRDLVVYSPLTLVLGASTALALVSTT